MTPPAPRFCPDALLGYEREAWRPEPGAGLTFDHHYRLAHLPLIAPDHPLVIDEAPGLAYRRGRRPAITSLVLAVDDAALGTSPAFDEMTRDIAAARFAHKICWPLVEQRRHRLHATVAGSLSDAEVAALTGPLRTLAPTRVGPIAVELRGLFAGRINRGRIYLRAYPELRRGGPALAAAQDLLGRSRSDIFLVGLYNLVEELDAAEAEALRDLIARWWDRPLLRWTADRLTLLSARDDLVRDSTIVGEIGLTAGRG